MTQDETGTESARSALGVSVFESPPTSVEYDVLFPPGEFEGESLDRP
jgi:hypothetical protein